MTERAAAYLRSLSCHKGWTNLIILHSSSNIGLLPLNFCQNFQNWLARSASLQMHQGISSIKLRAVSAKITLLSKDDESCVRADLYLQQYWRVTTLLLTVWSGHSDVTNGKCLSWKGLYHAIWPHFRMLKYVWWNYETQKKLVYWRLI